DLYVTGVQTCALPIYPRVGGPVKLGGTTVEAAKKWWAFQPLRRPAVPTGSFAGPVDAFIGAKLAGRKLSLSRAADRRTLIRRVKIGRASCRGRGEGGG